MDRKFCIQESWHGNRRYPDPSVLDWVLARWCPYYLDVSEIVPDDFEPAREDGVFSLVPIGSIQFARRWLYALGGADPAMTPLEVPDALLPYSGRSYRKMAGSEIPPELLDSRRYFVKDASLLKSWTSLLYDDCDLAYYIDSSHDYIVSDKLDIESEYRVFVLEDEIVGCRHYDGNPTLFPYGDALGEMVRAYAGGGSHPRAYTLDIAVARNPFGEAPEALLTVPLEVHPFVACGLYGFDDRCLLDMFEAGWRWYLEESGL